MYQKKKKGGSKLNEKSELQQKQFMGSKMYIKDVIEKYKFEHYFCWLNSGWFFVLVKDVYQPTRQINNQE